MLFQDLTLEGMGARIDGAPGDAASVPNRDLRVLDADSRDNFACSAGHDFQQAPGLGFGFDGGCGGRVRSFFCASCGHELAVPVSCGDRACPDCRKVEFSRLRRRYLPLVAQVEGRRLALMTLTLRIGPDAAGLAAQVGAIREDWSKLIRLAVWRPVLGGLAVVEAKYSRREGAWHVHIHALVEAEVVASFKYRAAGKLREGADLISGGRRLTPQALSEAWLGVTGDSYIVDVRPVRNFPNGRGGVRGALGYVLKYLVKPPGFPSWEARQAYSLMLRGRRLLHTFGAWHATAKRYRFARVEKLAGRAPCRSCGAASGWVSEWELRTLGVNAVAVRPAGLAAGGGRGPPMRARDLWGAV